MNQFYMSQFDAVLVDMLQKDICRYESDDMKLTM